MVEEVADLRPAPPAVLADSIEIEGIEGRRPGSETWIDKVRHPVLSRLAAARATRMSNRDHDLAWNNTGRNGHYSEFVWTGP